MQIEHARAIALRLGCDVLLTQFALNNLDLLTQIVFTLVFINLAFQARPEFRFRS